MKRILLKFFLYSFITMFFIVLFGFTVIYTMGTFIKGEEIKTPDFLNLSLKSARQKAYDNNIKLKELLLNSDISKPEFVISQYPLPGSLIKESGNREIKIFYTPKRSEIIMPDLSGLNISESKKVLSKNNLKWYYSFVYSDVAPIDYIISQTYIAGQLIKKGSRVTVLISKGRKRNSFIMPEVIGKNADFVFSFLEEKGIRVSKITYTAYEGLESGIIINQSPRQGYKINNRSIINLEVSE